MIRKILALAVLFVALPLAACDVDELLKAETGILVDAGGLESPSSAALLLNGAQSDFDCAHGAHIVAGGILSDEFADSQLGAAGWPLDRRDLATGDAYGANSCANNQTPGAYNGLAVARWSTDNILKKLQAWTDAEVPNRTSMIATAALLNGFSYQYLATDFCTAAVDLGPEQQPTALLTLAEQRFTTAIEAATISNNSAVLNAARIGRARVRLYLKNMTGAAADAKLVPVDFVYASTASDINGRRQNRVYAVNNQGLFYTIEPSARGLTLADGTTPDPRVRTFSGTIRAQDGTTLVTQTKYASLSASLPIARWAEAQLIIAEAEGGASAVTALNAVRAKSGVPALNATETTNLTNTIIQDRRRELFLEGFRLYDFNRFNLPFSPAAGTPYVRGGIYGSTKCMPLPDVERLNNPTLQG